MLTIQNQKKKCDAKDVKSKTKTVNPVKFAKSKSRIVYAESAKTIPT